MPSPDASMMPTLSGHPMTNSLHRLGLRVDSLNRVLQLAKDVIGSLFWWRYSLFCRAAKTWFAGFIKQSHSGIVMNACRNFASTDSDSLKGMPAFMRRDVRSQPFRIVSSVSHVSKDSHIVFLAQ